MSKADLGVQVAARSASDNRRRNAEEVIAEIQSHSPNLVAQTKLVSDELIRIAILWHEQWHEALEEASRLYFGECDVDGMLGVLLPLHDRLNEALESPAEGETSSEKFFKTVRCMQCGCVCSWLSPFLWHLILAASHTSSAAGMCTKRASTRELHSMSYER